MRTTKEILATDRKQFAGLDPVDAVLHLCGKYTFLPEIFEVFGPEKAWEFLKTFGGRTIKVPSDKNVNESITHLVMWTELATNPRHEAQKDTVKRLAHRFEVKDSDVRLAVARVQEMIDDQTRFQRQLSDFANENSTGSNERGSSPRASFGRVEEEPNMAGAGQPASGGQEGKLGELAESAQGPQKRRRGRPRKDAAISDPDPLD